MNGGEMFKGKKKPTNPADPIPLAFPVHSNIHFCPF